jgi:hypothetical protein
MQKNTQYFDLIVRYYEEFFGKVSGFMEYSFTPKPTQAKSVENFLLLLDKEVGLESIGETYLFDFLSYSFYLKKDQKTRFGKGVVMLNHVIGKKALSKWMDKPDNWWYWTDKFLTEYGIKRPLIKSIEANSTLLYTAEERIKQQSKGILNCSDFTTLFNPLSEFCNKCEEKLDCMSLLKEMYPNIYTKRIGL